MTYDGQHWHATETCFVALTARSRPGAALPPQTRPDLLLAGLQRRRRTPMAQTPLIPLPECPAKESRRSAKIGKNKGKIGGAAAQLAQPAAGELQPAVGRRGPLSLQMDSFSACPARRPASTETPSGGAGTSHTTMGTSWSRASRRAPCSSSASATSELIQPRRAGRWSPARTCGPSTGQPKEELVTGHEGPWWELHQGVPGGLLPGQAMSQGRAIATCPARASM